MRDDNEWLQDMLEAIERIERYSKTSRNVFDRDELIQTWMVHNIQIIGEAAAKLSEHFRTLYPEIPWRSIAAMRNIIVHAYFQVDLDEVWNVVKNDLPVLKQQLMSILEP